MKRNTELVERVAQAGDVIAEVLGIACARGARGEPLSTHQVQAVREAILQWHQIKAGALEEALGG